MMSRSTRRTSGARFAVRGFAKPLSTFAVAATLLTLGSDLAFADYVGSLANRIFLDPASVPALINGYDNGDELSFILETTPRDTGSIDGHAAWNTVFVPPGVQVIGAAFVDPGPGGSWVIRNAEDTDESYGACGVRNCKNYTPTTGSPRLGNGAVNEVQQDTGIFFSSDPRTANHGTQILPQITPTGPKTKPAVIYSQWDYDQVLAFGKSGSLSGNNGTGNTPLISTDSGSSWKGTGSPVAGADARYTNDYNPACDCGGSCPSSALFVSDAQCTGPWQRIAYPNSKFGGSGTIAPVSGDGAIGNTSVPAVGGFALSGANPLPAGTNAIRFAHGKRTLGDLEYSRVTLRITDVAAFTATLANSEFCMESVGADTSKVAAKDNNWRYYEPAHNCGPGVHGVLLKQAAFVGGLASDGTSLHAGDVIGWTVTFTNISAGALNTISITDAADSNVTLVEPGAEAKCPYASYDGDLPGPAYVAGSATGGTAAWSTVSSIPSGSSFTVNLCGLVSGSAVEGDIVSNTSSVLYHLPDASTESQSSTATGSVISEAECTTNSDCNDGVFCNGPEVCSDSFCGHTEDPCEGGPVCGDVCNEEAKNCFVTSSTECRASAGSCDEAEHCTGTSADCPVDGFKGDSTPCTGSAQGGICDDDTGDHCAGSSDACVDSYKTTAVTCRASSGQCDAAEKCDGTSSTCPADASEPSDVPCDGSSQGGACDDDSGDHCSGSGDVCVDSFKPGSVVCRDSAGECDVAENCDGSTGSCASDGFAAPDVPCTGSSQGGLCNDDSGDHCAGTSNSCVDAFASVGLTCRSSAGPCDVAENCTGSTGNCPGDDLASTATVCRAATGDCDAAELCDGALASCPADLSQPDTASCDDGFYCNGTDTCVDGTCDDHSGSPCGDGVGCTVDSCNEDTNSCLHTPDNGSCSNGLFCDGAEICNAVSDCQPGSDPCQQTNPCAVATCDEQERCGVDPLDGVPCDDANLCTIDDGCSNGQCVGTRLLMADLCPWIVLHRDDPKLEKVKIGRQTTLNGDLCGGTVFLGKTCLVKGDAVSGLASGIKAMRLVPEAMVAEDIVTAGGGALAIPSVGKLPYLAPTSALAPGSVMSKIDNTGFYDLSGNHPLVAPCVAGRTGFAPVISALDALPSTFNVGGTKGLKLGIGQTRTITATAPGSVNVVDLVALKTGEGVTIELDGGGDADTVMVLRVAKKWKLFLNGKLNLTGGLVPQNVLIYVKGRKCDIGDNVEGSGTFLCAAGRLKVRRGVTWTGAFFGARKLLKIGDLTVVDYAPFRAF